MNRLYANIKRIPVSTWNWLGVNESKITLHSGEDDITDGCTDFTEPARRHSLECDFTELSLKEDPEGFFINDEIRSFIEYNKTSGRYFKIPKGHGEDTPIALHYHIKRNCPLVDDIVIEAEEDSRCTLILKYTSEEGSSVHHCGRIRIFAGKNSKVKLVKAQLMDKEATHTDIIAAAIEDGAQVHVISAEMGASSTISGCNLVLKGSDSRADLDILYLGDGTRSIDISSRAEHRGKRSVSGIRARGILSGQSKKIFRDTIDFIRGSSGSRGKEEESVLMLDPGVMNLSVPILLCGEDDVEGEHAATSGRPDDRLMFYLMSRGLNKQEARKLLAEAAFSSALQSIPHVSLRNEILEILKKSI